MGVESEGFRKVSARRDECEWRTQEPQEVPESGNKVRSEKGNKVHTNIQSSNQRKRNTKRKNAESENGEHGVD